MSLLTASKQVQVIGYLYSRANEDVLTHMNAQALACQTASCRGTCIGFASALICERRATFAR